MMTKPWGVVLVSGNGMERVLPHREETEAEAYLIALQIRDTTPFRVETRRLPATFWDVYRNGPGAARVRVARMTSEEQARSFVRAEKRVRKLLQAAGPLAPSFWKTPAAGIVYTVEEGIEESLDEHEHRNCRLDRLPRSGYPPKPPDRSDDSERSARPPV